MHLKIERTLVQSGRIRALGARGRRFESYMSDQFYCVVSSAVEQGPYKARVGGSIPSPRTSFMIAGVA